jgi:hypothetical protein
MQLVLVTSTDYLMYRSIIMKIRLNLRDNLDAKKCLNLSVTNLQSCYLSKSEKRYTTSVNERENL